MSGKPDDTNIIQDISGYETAGMDTEYDIERKVHHFGVSMELWNEIKREYNGNWELKEFMDVFYDTEDHLVAKNNQWLRQREFKDGRLEWSLKTTKDDKRGFCLVQEANEVEVIMQLLSYAPKRKQPNSIKDQIYGTFELELFAFFPTTRVYLDDRKLYIDCANEELTETWFLIGGLKVKDTSKLRELQTKWSHYSTEPVMTKITQMILWKEPELYDSLVHKGFLRPEAEFTSESHIHSDGAPLFPCSMI